MAKQGARLKKRLIWAAGLAIVLVIIVAITTVAINTSNSEFPLRNQVVELNDVREELTKSTLEESDVISAKADLALAYAQDALRAAAESRNTSTLAAIMLVSLIAIAAIGTITLYLYRIVVRPFMKLECFAEEVASGNLDMPLPYERSNPFGKFTWAFEHLRMELERSRKEEELADEAYKTALASLSHDLRTPLASLRAYAEALEMGLAPSELDRTKYELAIMRKCDEVSALVEDLFQHALSDMDRIKVECTPVQASAIVKRCVHDLSPFESITCGRLDNALIEADAARLSQAIDNIISNSLKYAHGSTVVVEGTAENEEYIISIRDFGSGMPPEDIAFATNRFYRGSNAQGHPGSGLGLYIVAHLVERMGGRISLQNAHPGFKVEIKLPIMT